MNATGQREQRVPATWEIPTEIRSRLSDRSGRQRTMVTDGHIVMVLHKAPRSNGTEREGVYFWRSAEGEWRHSERGQTLPALGTLIEEYCEAVAKLESAYDRAEDADALFAVLEAVAPIYRAARNLYDTLQAARGAIPDKLARAELQGPCDVASDVARIAELLQIDARNALDFRIAKQAELQAAISRDMARAGNRLNLIACVFLPLVAIAGVFGMNLRNGLEGSPAWLFWALLICGAGLGAMIGAAVMGIPTERSTNDSAQSHPVRGPV